MCELCTEKVMVIQCVVCQTPITYTKAQERMLAACSNCGTQVRLPIGFQARPKTDLPPGYEISKRHMDGRIRKEGN